jgi:hypothetical protein
MRLSNQFATRHTGISQRSQMHIDLIRDTARALGIEDIDVQASDLLKDTFRIQFDDCTGRKQVLFIPLTASPSRICQTLRFVSGPRLISH